LVRSRLPKAERYRVTVTTQSQSSARVGTNPTGPCEHFHSSRLRSESTRDSQGDRRLFSRDLSSCSSSSFSIAMTRTTRTNLDQPNAPARECLLAPWERVGQRVGPLLLAHKSHAKADVVRGPLGFVPQPQGRAAVFAVIVEGPAAASASYCLPQRGNLPEPRAPPARRDCSRLGKEPSGPAVLSPARKKQL